MDFDGDGRPDLISGSNCCDWFGFHVYRRTGSDSWAPRQAYRVSQESAFTKVGIMNQSTVTAADWDGDGIPDLLWRSPRNHGIAVARGPFPEGQQLDLAHQLDFTPHPTAADERVVDMTVADWDRDGKPDLFVRQRLDGGKGGIYWYRNLGGPGLKQLAPGAILLGEDTLAGPVPAARSVTGFCVGDWDGDGWPDLIVARQDLTPPTPAGSWRVSVWLYRRE